MTYEEFTHRWRQLNYNRKKEQGEEVEFPPDNRSSHRKAFGRNGKGRHSMFCFASEYFVETWRDGETNKFLVKRTTSIAETPYKITHLGKLSREGHGTIVSAELARHHLKEAEIRDLIGSKFVTDPTFSVYVNGGLVELTDLEHLLDIREIAVPDVGAVRVSQVDTQRTSRTSHPHGVAWWVNRRLVGEPSWRDFDESVFVDRRTVEAKRYTFVVEADGLADDVEQDWSGFRDTERVDSVHQAVGEHIRQRLAELMRDVHRARKRAVLEDNVESLAQLSVESRYYIGQLVDGVQKRMPSIQQRALSATVTVLSNLERARSGYM
jgi:hypothetical protein